MIEQNSEDQEKELLSYLEKLKSMAQEVGDTSIIKILNSLKKTAKDIENSTELQKNDFLFKVDKMPIKEKNKKLKDVMGMMVTSTSFRRKIIYFNTI
ncbi:MAG: hypothetical protein KAI43_02965 [Candidatus Aureabacteria bacterium]|nr:hypothetical protein [Candidatus Auribacterota bacterium]